MKELVEAVTAIPCVLGEYVEGEAVHRLPLPPDPTEPTSVVNRAFLGMPWNGPAGASSVAVRPEPL